MRKKKSKDLLPDAIKHGIYFYIFSFFLEKNKLHLPFPPSPENSRDSPAYSCIITGKIRDTLVFDSNVP